MNRGLLLVTALLVVADLVFSTEEAPPAPLPSPPPTSIPETSVDSETIPRTSSPEPVAPDPVPEGPVPSPESIPAPAPPKGLIVKDFSVGEPNQIVENPTLDEVKLTGTYKGVIYLDDYVRHGQPYSAKVLRYTKKFDKGFRKRVEVRIMDGEESLDPIIFTCRICAIPTVYIDKGKLSVYNNKDIYGVLMNRVKKTFVVMKNNVCLDKRPPTAIVQKSESIEEMCHEYMLEMKNPGRNGALHSIVVFFSARLPKLFSGIHGWLFRPPPAPPAPPPKPKPSAASLMGLKKSPPPK